MAAEMLREPRVDVDSPSEIVTRDAIACDRQAGLEMQKVHTTTHVKNFTDCGMVCQVLYTAVVDVRERLKAAGERRSAARAEMRAATAEIRELVREARAEGAAKTEIARLAQISRPALDEMLHD